MSIEFYLNISVIIKNITNIFHLKIIILFYNQYFLSIDAIIFCLLEKILIGCRSFLVSFKFL